MNEPHISVEIYKINIPDTPVELFIEPHGKLSGSITACFTISGCQHCDAFGVTQAVFAGCGRAGQDGFDPEKFPTPDTTDTVCYGKVLGNFSSSLGPRWHWDSCALLPCDNDQEFYPGKEGAQGRPDCSLQLP